MVRFRTTSSLKSSVEGGGFAQPVPEITKKISCATQLKLNFFLLINIKMPFSDFDTCKLNMKCLPICVFC